MDFTPDDLRLQLSGATELLLRCAGFAGMFNSAQQEYHDLFAEVTHLGHPHLTTFVLAILMDTEDEVNPAAQELYKRLTEDERLVGMCSFRDAVQGMVEEPPLSRMQEIERGAFTLGPAQVMVDCAANDFAAVKSRLEEIARLLPNQKASLDERWWGRLATTLLERHSSGSE